jgi:hypothetical protein
MKRLSRPDRKIYDHTCADAGILDVDTAAQTAD